EGPVWSKQIEKLYDDSQSDADLRSMMLDRPFWPQSEIRRSTLPACLARRTGTRSATRLSQANFTLRLLGGGVEQQWLPAPPPRHHKSGGARRLRAP
ncbi:MAG TPA: hypothetical protein VGJ72_08760, partial [Polaromonas sp.]